MRCAVFIVPSVICCFSLFFSKFLNLLVDAFVAFLDSKFLQSPCYNICFVYFSSVSAYTRIYQSLFISWTYCTIVHLFWFVLIVAHVIEHVEKLAHIVIDWTTYKRTKQLFTIFRNKRFGITKHTFCVHWKR